MMNLEVLRERWLADRPLYEEFCKRIKQILEDETRQLGIVCTVQARPKEVSSFLKKALLKKYADPYEEIHDKAGARIICTYSASLPQLEQMIRKLFVVRSYDNKKLGLDYDKLGYLGIHFEVELPSELLKSHEKFRGLICEIQLHTHAQNLWADVSHELSYKPSQPSPVEIKRLIYRLMALVEIFDDEVAKARETLLGLPGFEEAQMLDILDNQFYRFTAKHYDRELSLKTLLKLRTLLSKEELAGFGSLVEAFVQRNEDKLVEIFCQYADDDRSNPLLFQPEAFLIFERLEKDPFRLKDIWADIFPVELLESLATIWGKLI